MKTTAKKFTSKILDSTRYYILLDQLDSLVAYIETLEAQYALHLSCRESELAYHNCALPLEVVEEDLDELINQFEETYV
jgi:hypothetical protein